MSHVSNIYRRPMLPILFSLATPQRQLICLQRSHKRMRRMRHYRPCSNPSRHNMSLVFPRSAR